MSRDRLAPERSFMDRLQRDYRAPERSAASPSTASYVLESTVEPTPEGVDEAETSPCANRQRSHERPDQEPEAEGAADIVSNNDTLSIVQIERQIKKSICGCSLRSKRPLSESIHKDRFHLGAAHAWAPWKIRGRVIELLQEPFPMPKTGAQVYVATVSNVQGRYVKIGYTDRKIKRRLNEIAGKHQVTFDTDRTWSTPKMEMKQAKRLEALVHADLAFSQRDLCVVGDTKTAVHAEYFEVSLKEAQSTIQMWHSIMERISMQPGRRMSDHATKRVWRCSNAFEIRDLDQHTPQAEQWRCLNEDHERRRSVWQTLLRKDATYKDALTPLVLGVPSVLILFAYTYQLPGWLLAWLLGATWTLFCVFHAELVEWTRSRLLKLR